YRQGDTEVVALDAVFLDIPRGQYCAVMGPSGSGKSTLLGLIAGLDTASSGDVIIDGRRQREMSDDEITLFRRRKIGFVFQFFNLLPTLTVEENVALPLLLDGRRLPTERLRVRNMLDLVGLTHRAAHRPREL